MSRIGSVNAELEKAAAEDREVEFSTRDLQWLLSWEKYDILQMAGYDVDEVREILADDPEANGETTGDEAPKSYADMTVAELRAELTARQLPGDGTKATLVTRLEEDDASQE